MLSTQSTVYRPYHWSARESERTGERKQESKRKIHILFIQWHHPSVVQEEPMYSIECQSFVCLSIQNDPFHVQYWITTFCLPFQYKTILFNATDWKYPVIGEIYYCISSNRDWNVISCDWLLEPTTKPQIEASPAWDRQWVARSVPICTHTVHQTPKGPCPSPLLVCPPSLLSLPIP